MGYFLGKLLFIIFWGMKDYGIFMVGFDNVGEEFFFLSFVNIFCNICIMIILFCIIYESNYFNVKSSVGNLCGLWV